jgi:hypothetical protein
MWHSEDLRYKVEVVEAIGADDHINRVNSEAPHLYPDPLRCIHHFGAEKDLRLVFLTINCQLPALTIADLYCARWRVELIFRRVNSGFISSLSSALRKTPSRRKFGRIRVPG